MKDVKVDVRVNVTVDPASVFLVLATMTTGWFLYKQNKREQLAAKTSQLASQ